MAVSPPPSDVIRRYYPQLVWAVPRFNLLASALPGTVTSWWRSPSKNQSVGGQPRSQHLAGLAFDIVIHPSQVASFVAIARQLELVPVVEGDHVHVQAFPAGTLDI